MKLAETIPADLFGYVANFTDAQTGAKGIFKINSSKPDREGMVFGRMISGGTIYAMRGEGEWVHFEKELSKLRK